MNSDRNNIPGLNLKRQKPSPAKDTAIKLRRKPPLLLERAGVRRFKIKHFSLFQIIRFRLSLSGSIKSMCSDFPSPNPLPLERAFFSRRKYK